MGKKKDISIFYNYYGYYLGNPFSNPNFQKPDYSIDEILSGIEANENDLGKEITVFFTYCAYFHELYQQGKYDEIKSRLALKEYKKVLKKTAGTKSLQGYIKDFKKFEDYEFFRDRFEMYKRFMDKQPKIIGSSDRIQKVKGDLFENIFGSNILYDFIDGPRLKKPLLILGETGTGKELAAELVAYTIAGGRKDYWAKVNISQVSESILESELFGHKKGAFTGAATDRPGLFGQPEPVLFLDEIGHFTKHEKLLRAIEYGEYQRVGGDKSLTHDKYIIAATSAPMDAPEYRAKRGLDEFYMRFSVVRMPKLNERLEDVPDILSGMAKLNFTEDMKNAFMKKYSDYDFHEGNVRELLNKAISFKKRYDPVIGTSNSSEKPTDRPKDFLHVIENAKNLKSKANELVRAYARYVYEKVGKSPSRAREILGISYNTLKKYLEKAGTDIAVDNDGSEK